MLTNVGNNKLYVSGSTADIQQELLDKHYFRKHGAGAYYGQK